jgi:hypothetical protein
VPNDDKLYIVGHGSFEGTSLQTLSAKDLFATLETEGLPKRHRPFYLFSCYSGVVMPGAGSSFAEAFAREIKEHYASAVVFGYLGAVSFKRGLDFTPVSKEVSRTTEFRSGSSTRLDAERAKGAKVSFSIRRKILSHKVSADQDDAYVARKTQETEELSWQDEVVQRSFSRVVVERV